MRKFASLAAATVIGAAALAGPVLAGSATAAETAPVAAAAAKAKAKITFKRGFQHFQQIPDTATVKVKGVKKGKVTWSVNGTKFAKSKLKKGKSSVTLSPEFPVGTHKLQAKIKGKKKVTAKKKFIVYSGGIQPNAAEFTYSVSTKQLFNLAGTVTYKGQPGLQAGYVDLYKAPYTKGITGPDFLCDANIVAGGAFDFTNEFCMNDLAVGDYELRAFYTNDAGSDAEDYLTGAPIILHVVP